MQNKTIIKIARIAHDANRKYCLLLGDTSVPSWENAPAWMQDSAIKGVKAHLAAWREGALLTMAESHQHWLDEKVRQGWKFGPEKDAEAKTHPCMAPYEELPTEQRVKDLLFGKVVEAALSLYVARDKHLKSVGRKEAKPAVDPARFATPLPFPPQDGVVPFEDRPNHTQLAEQA